jgi:fluoroacetyl-CoA thioesterase
MRPGLVPGVRAEHRVVVLPEMTPDFVPYPVYSTYRMARDCEWAARLVILPFLEAGEEGVGAGLRLRHGRPAPVGASLLVAARCTAVRGPLVVCRVEVRHGEERVGWGVVHQLLLPAGFVRQALRGDRSGPDAARR